MGNRYGRGSVSIDTTVEVYLDEILDELDEADLLAALDAKGGGKGDEGADVMVRRAYDALLRNRPNEAFACLSAYLFPAHGPRWRR